MALMNAFLEEVEVEAASKNVTLPPKPSAEAPASLRALLTAPLPAGATHGRAEGAVLAAALRARLASPSAPTLDALDLPERTLRTLSKAATFLAAEEAAAAHQAAVAKTLSACTMLTMHMRPRSCLTMLTMLMRAC